MAKIAASLKAGDRLPPRTYLSRTAQRVYEVDQYTKDGGEWIKVTTEEGFEDHFPITAPVVYPRNWDGHNRVFLDEDTVLPMEEIAIGDIIRPAGAEGPVTLKEAWVVRHIISQSHGWSFTAAEVAAGEAHRFFVHTRFEGDIYEEAAMQLTRLSEDVKLRGRSVNASGWYINQLSGEKVRFRLGKLKGRPPVGSEEAPHELGVGLWNIYDLVDGEIPHPDDPRYSAAE